MGRLLRGVFPRVLSLSLVLAMLVAVPVSPSFAGATAGSSPPAQQDSVQPLSWSAASVRVAGADRLQTSVAVSQQGWDSSDVVVIATARDFPDALAGGPLAALYNAPLLTTEADHLPEVVAEEITRLGATTAIVLGGTQAISLSVDAELYDAGITTIDRIGGADRYETAGMVAERFSELKGGAEGVIIATGRDFPDALAVSGFAGWFGTPILLTASDHIPAGTLSALGTIDPGSALIVGGTAAVGTAVEDALPNPVRIGGTNRYDTARLIAEFAFSNGFSYENVFVATGKNFPDALAVGPLAAQLQAPVVLTDPSTLSAATDEFFNEHCSSIQTVFVLGGEAAVSPEVVGQIDAATETRMAEEVEVLSTDTISAITTITADGTMIMDASTAGLASIQTSDVLVAGPSASTPYGFLVRVTAINVSPTAGDTVSIETTAASLDEVIEKGSIDVTGSIDPTFQEPSSATFGMDSAAAVADTAVRLDFAPDDSVNPAWSLGGQLNIPFEVSVGTEGELKNAEWGAAATVSGNVFMRGDFVFNIAFGTVGYYWAEEWYWDWGLKSRWVQRPISGITTLETKVYLSESFDFNLAVAGTIGKSIDVVELLEEKGVTVEVPLAQTWIWIGWVPVHIGLSAQPIIEAGINFGVEGSVGFRQACSVTIGCAYDYRYGWRNLGASSQSFQFTEPQLGGTAEASLSIGGKVNVKFYGLAGPYFGSQATLGIGANTADDPWWEAGLSLEGVYGGEFEVFSRKWAVGGSVEFYNWDIAAAPGPFPAGGIVWWPASVQSASATVGQFTPVTWILEEEPDVSAMQVTAAVTPALALDPSTVDASDFAIQGLDILSATVLSSGDQIILTVSPMQRGTEYVVTCPAGALFDMVKAPVMNSTAGFTGYYQPELSSAWADSDTAAMVEFDVGTGALDPATVDASDFLIPGLTVTDAQLDFSGSQVLLTTSAQSAGVDYTIGCADGAIMSIEGFPSAASSASFFGFYEPVVASAAPVNGTTVDVVFDVQGSILDSTLVDKADFTIPGLTIGAATLRPDGVTVRLTTSAQIAGSAYTVNTAADAVTAIQGYTSPAGSVGFTGYYQPAIVSAATDAADSVTVVFDAYGSELDPATIAASDFSIAGLTVTGAALQPDGVTVLLTTSSQTQGAAYTVGVTAGAISSVEGYPVALSSAGFVGYWPVTTDYAYDVDATTVAVVLDSMDAVDPTSIDVTDFTVFTKLTLTPLNVTGAVLQPDGHTVLLTTDVSVPGVAYEVDVVDGAITDGTFTSIVGSTTFTGTSTFSESAGGIPATDSLMAMAGIGDTAYATGMQGFTYRTTNGGTTWAKVGTAQPGEVGNSYDIAFPDPTDPTVLVVPGYGGSISRSIDSATSFVLFNNPAVTTNHNSGAGFAGSTGRGYIVHGSGGLIESTDGGISWHRHPTQDLEVKGGCVVFSDDLHGYIGSAVGSIWITGDSGVSWAATPTGLTGYIVRIAVSPDDPMTLVAAADNGGIARSEDYGATWTVVSSGTTQPLYELQFSDGNVMFAGGAQGIMLMSRDAGRTWGTIRAANVALPAVGAMWVKDANSVWIGGTGGVNSKMTGM